MIMSVFELPTTTIERVRTPCLSFGGNQDSQADHVKRKHRREQTVRPQRCPVELLPDEHTPYRAHHRRSLTEAVRQGRSGRGAGHDAEAHAYIPYHAAEDADQVQPRIAFGEIV